jgi:hypothetical protein
MIKICENTAKFRAPWAGKIIKCCIRHAAMLEVMGRSMGNTLQVEVIENNDLKCECIAFEDEKS